MTSMYIDNGKISIGVEADFYTPSIYDYDFGGRNLCNGVEIFISAKTANRKFIFGVAWLNNVTKENDVETWLAADPTIVEK